MFFSVIYFQHDDVILVLCSFKLNEVSCKLRRGTHVWPFCILQILKMLATKNKTEYSISDLLFP